MRYSKQREEILNIIKDANDHPTALMIYERLKKKIPKVSLGTVYRNLGFLVNEGLVNKISTKNGYDHYDKVSINHNHLCCEECGKIIDINVCIGNKELRKLENETGFKITNGNFKINGICASCIKERKE